jgi:hypothetical protein
VPSHFSQCFMSRSKEASLSWNTRPRSPFAVHPNVSGRPRPLLLTEPRHTPKILSLQKRNDGRGRPSHNVETCPSWRAALARLSKYKPIPYYHPSIPFPLRVLCVTIDENFFPCEDFSEKSFASLSNRARPDFARPTSRPALCHGAPKRSDGGVVLVLWKLSSPTYSVFGWWRLLLRAPRPI